MRISGDDSFYGVYLGGSVVGAEGLGAIEVLDGAGYYQSYLLKLGDSPGSFGSVTVSGEGSSWEQSAHALPGKSVYVGNAGRAELSVLDGADFLASHLRIGVELGSNGNVVVSGAGSTLHSNAFGDQGLLQVGMAGAGSLSVVEGGSVKFAGGGISGGDQGELSRVVVSGLGSTLELRALLIVGSERSALLIVKEGSRFVSPGSLRIGNLHVDEKQLGTVAVAGENSLVSAHEINVGGHSNGLNSSGVLRVTHQASVAVSGALDIADLSGTPTGVYLHSSGSLALTGDTSASLEAFLDQIEGRSDAVYYPTPHGWRSITEATRGVDYTLDLIVGGEFDGYTRLTVLAVPEPAAGLLVLLAVSVIGCGRHGLCR
ncbi:hypothetical protein [Pseudobythopirellula maris]|uniref:hypothetical protein n=1 Tax=Pseudobythopirellula maris TaxID=2527991 RepID=UPI0018D3D18C|nr:hypothetical protein [Pseudobythopirellula maris]